MATLDVYSVNEKISCIENLEASALEREAALIAKDLKTYILNNFSVDGFQAKILDRTSSDTFKEMGTAISNAFLNRYTIKAEPSSRVKCPKVTITVSISFEF